MKAFLATTCILTGAMLAGGCATKKYVRNTTAPIQAKVDQVGEQTTRNGQQIDDTNKNLKQVDESAKSGISAAQERASAADQHAAAADQKAVAADQKAGEAMQKAVQVGEQSQQGLNSLRGVIANLDDYKLQTSVAVPFSFDKWSLTPDAKQELDKIAGEIKSGKRFFVAVEGYTDATGSRAYNEALSRKRADAVVQYLVAKHEVPIYRVHMIGLGVERPVDEGKGRDARAKNRRVEVKVYSADKSTSAVNTEASGNLAVK
jgi:outer membrane protein OmpA-like peptidoglycan-associated protein